MTITAAALEARFESNTVGLMRGAAASERRMVQAERHIGGTVGRMNKSFGGLGKTLLAGGAIAAAGIAIAGVTSAVRLGTGELISMQAANAQTAAGLKSTGGVANVTQRQITNLANAILMKSGIDDQAVQSSENMLLTFTNVRNEAGKGRDIFNQATQAVADMATKMANGAIPTTEQMAKTSIQVGKALNDPVKGYTALKKVGVAFSDAQKKQIKTFAEHGQMAKAQGVILKELSKEFGGAAQAAGGTAAGQISIMREKLAGLGATIVGGVLPHLLSLEGRFEQAVSKGGALRPIVDALKQSFEILRGAIAPSVASFQDAFGGADAAGGSMKSLVQWVAQAAVGISRFVASALVPMASVLGAAAGVLARHTTLAKAMGLALLGLVNPIAGVGVAIALLVGPAKHAFESIRDTVSKVFMTIQLTILKAMEAIYGAMGKVPGKLGAPFRQAHDIIAKQIDAIQHKMDSLDSSKAQVAIGGIGAVAVANTPSLSRLASSVSAVGTALHGISAADIAKAERMANLKNIAGKNSGLNANTAPGAVNPMNVANHARGGPIKGPGSGTSDSILARVSNGEFVVRADGSNLTDAMGFFGIPGYAKGGPVKSKKSPSQLAGAAWTALTAKWGADEARENNRWDGISNLKARDTARSGFYGREIGAFSKFLKGNRKALNSTQESRIAKAIETAKGKGAAKSQFSDLFSSFAGRTAQTQSELELAMARAELTPDGGDDASARAALATFFGGEAGRLGSFMTSARTGADRAEVNRAVTAALQSQKSYTDSPDVATSSGGGGSEVSPDMQAALDQANTRATNAAANLALSQSQFGILNGSNDIGYGGGANAYQAAGGAQPTVIINSLTGADPRTAKAVADVMNRGNASGGNADRMYSGRVVSGA